MIKLEKKMEIIEQEHEGDLDFKAHLRNLISHWQRWHDG